MHRAAAKGDIIFFYFLYMNLIKTTHYADFYLIYIHGLGE